MLAVAGDTVIDDSVFVPPEPLPALDTPPQASPAIVKASVEVVKTEESTKRREAFIYSLFILGTHLWVGRSFRRGTDQIGCPISQGIGTFDCRDHIFSFGQYRVSGSFALLRWLWPEVPAVVPATSARNMSLRFAPLPCPLASYGCLQVCCWQAQFT